MIEKVIKTLNYSKIIKNNFMICYNSQFLSINVIAILTELQIFK